MIYFRTKVRLYSEVDGPNLSDQYEPISLMMHECTGQVLECSLWICKDGKTIGAGQLCDGKIDCEDQSDEEKDLCNGESGLVSLIIKRGKCVQ